MIFLFEKHENFLLFYILNASLKKVCGETQKAIRKTKIQLRKTMTEKARKVPGTTQNLTCKEHLILCKLLRVKGERNLALETDLTDKTRNARHDVLCESERKDTMPNINTYIIYDKQTNEVTDTLKFFGQIRDAIKKGNGELDWLSMANPSHQPKLKMLIYPI